jgi:hypothetical protein
MAQIKTPKTRAIAGFWHRTRHRESPAPVAKPKPDPPIPTIDSTHFQTGNHYRRRFSATLRNRDRFVCRTGSGKVAVGEALARPLLGPDLFGRRVSDCVAQTATPVSLSLRPRKSGGVLDFGLYGGVQAPVSRPTSPEQVGRVARGRLGQSILRAAPVASVPAQLESHRQSTTVRAQPASHRKYPAARFREPLRLQARKRRKRFPEWVMRHDSYFA